MLTNESDISSQESYRHNPYQVDDDIKQYESYEMLPLIAGINGLHNSSEERVGHSVFFTSGESNDASSKAKCGWLKRLLNVVAVLTGVGVIAAGGYYLFGRMNANYSSNNTLLPHLDNPSATLNNFEWNSSNMQFDNSEFPIDSNQISDSSNFPYQDIYWDSPGRNKALDFIPTTVAKNSGTETFDQDISAAPLTAHSKNIDQDNYSDNLTKKNDYPLGEQFHRDLSVFCLSGIHSTVIKSYRSTPEKKCKLLVDIIVKINLYKDMDYLLRDINFRRKPLTPVDSTEEILSRRKVTMLYLAAETIINGKDIDILHFYNNAMQDYKTYSSEELIARESKIMNYYSEHHALGEC